MSRKREEGESCANCVSTLTMGEGGKPESEPFCDGGEITAPHWCEKYKRCDIHHIKTHPIPFAESYKGYKKCEVRVNDRGYQKGDILCL